MNQQIANSSSINNGSRCTHLTGSGRRCRLRTTGSGSGFCFRHAQLREAALDAEDLSTHFAQFSEFKSASQINEFLTQLTALLIQNRIPTRRAAVLAYIHNLLLRSLRAIEHEENPSSDDTQLILDMPGPDRSEPPIRSIDNDRPWTGSSPNSPTIEAERVFK